MNEYWKQLAEGFTVPFFHFLSEQLELQYVLRK